MLLPLAERLSLDLMARHDLAGWRFKFSRSLTRFGQCSYGKKIISLSRHLTLMNGEPVVRNTVLHEIAHALVGHRAAHGPLWKRKALEIGCDGRRTYGDGVIAPPRKAVGHCPGCHRVIRRHRRRALYCLPCRSTGKPSRIQWER